MHASSLSAGSVKRDTRLSQHLAWVICTIGFTGLLFQRIHEFPPATLAALTDFTASRLFQFRVLVPAAVHFARLLLPFPLDYFYFATSAISVYLILFFFERLLRAFSMSDGRLSSLFILYPLAVNYLIIGHYYYPSDLLSIALVEAALMMAIEVRWPLFVLTIFIGSLNRDAIAVTLPLALLVQWPANKTDPFGPKAKALYRTLGFSLLILILIHLGLSWIFRNNPGTQFEWQLEHNQQFFSSLFTGDWKAWARVVLVFGGLPWLIFLRYKRLHPALKRLLLVIPPFVLIMCLIGMLREVRIFGELIPIITLGALFALQKKTIHVATTKPS